MKTIRRGDTGEDVRVWQRALAVNADGIFGPITEARTLAWQRARGLVPDGVVGAKTWATLLGAPPPLVDGGAELPARRTPVALETYVEAIRDASEGISREGVAVLWAQYQIETGGSACWNWNIGNVKKVRGDGYDFHFLHGVWEGVSPKVAADLIAKGEAVRDPSENHARAVGPARISVIFQPPHPACMFRAYANLAVAMRSHVAFLQRRYGEAWTIAQTGDVQAFARSLRSRGYFTASAEAYAAGMRAHYNKAMQR